MINLQSQQIHSPQLFKIGSIFVPLPALIQVVNDNGGVTIIPANLLEGQIKNGNLKL